MSNPALNRLLRSGGLSDFHVGREAPAARLGDPHVLFAGERFHATFSAKTEEKGYNKAHDFSDKKNREDPKKRKKDDGSSDGSSGTERALDVEEHSSELSFADGKVHFIEISK